MSSGTYYIRERMPGKARPFVFLDGDEFGGEGFNSKQDAIAAWV